MRLPTFPLVPVLRRLLPTIYCLPTFPLVTCHSSPHLGGKKPQSYKAGRRYLLASSGLQIGQRDLARHFLPAERGEAIIKG